MTGTTTRLLAGVVLTGAAVAAFSVPAAASAAHHPAPPESTVLQPRTTHAPAALPVTIGSAVAYVHGPDGAPISVPPSSLVPHAGR